MKFRVVIITTNISKLTQGFFKIFITFCYNNLKLIEEYKSSGGSGGNTLDFQAGVSGFDS